MTFSDQLTIAGLVVGMIGIIGSIIGILSPAIHGWWRKRRQIREVWASIDELWEPVKDDVNHRVLTGGRLVVRNPTPWTLQEVMIMRPSPLEATNFKLIAPKSKIEMILPAQLTNDVSGELIVLQVTDNQGLTWRWTPSEEKAELLSQRNDRLSRGERWASRNVRSRIVATEPPAQGEVPPGQ